MRHTLSCTEQAQSIQHLPTQWCPLSWLGNSTRSSYWVRNISRTLSQYGPAAAAAISTPLVLDTWRAALQSQSDRGWVECLLTGIREGFRICLIQTPQYQSSQGNTLSVTDKAEVVSSFLTSQCGKGRMLGPFPPEDSTGVITSHMAVIPKKVAGKWRVIVDLSSPHIVSIATSAAVYLMHRTHPRMMLQC